MKEMRNLKVGLEYHTMLRELTESTGIPITILAEIAIKRIMKVDVSELTKVQKEKDAAYERALQRLSDEISPVIPVVPKKDSYDKMIDKTFPPKQEIKVINDKTPAIRSDGGVDEIDIADILDA